MKFFACVVPALLAVSGLVQAAAVIPRSNDDGFLSEFLDELNKNNLTILADNYQRIAYTGEGKSIIDLLESHELTILAPDDCAFDKGHGKEGDNTTIDPRVIEYSTLWGNIDKGFETTEHRRRAASSQSRSVARSTFRRSSAPRRKRQQNEHDFQVQVVDKLTHSASRKRWNDDTILVDRPIGTARVVRRFSFKKLVILIIDTLLTLPPKVSELLCKPLIKDTPNGFKKTLEALEKTDLVNLVNTKDAITIFVPVDESVEDIGKHSKDELTSFVKNHIITDDIVFSPMFAKVCKATAFSGKELQLSYENDIHYVSCGKSRAIVLRSDVISTNGVVHVIDRPLECEY
ncbi:FAS1 domain-containing protein [Rhizoctonia solani]|nr:FAS1 domain-containing protein [Rhizoctonia solani]